MSDKGKLIPPYDQPTRAEAVDGEVTLTGPGNIGVSLTPEAAHASAREIAAATAKAHEQREAKVIRISRDPSLASSSSSAKR